MELNIQVGESVHFQSNATESLIETLSLTSRFTKGEQVEDDFWDEWRL